MKAQDQALLERLAAYLEREPTAGDATLPEGEAPDLFTLLAELAALRNEVKLESRQVKSALDQFGDLFDTLRDANRRLQEDLDRQRDRAAAERREAEQS
nr:nucleotide exchange factor GrpE [Chromatiaceae bacterium]